MAEKKPKATEGSVIKGTKTAAPHRSAKQSAAAKKHEAETKASARGQKVATKITTTAKSALKALAVESESDSVPEAKPVLAFQRSPAKPHAPPVKKPDPVKALVESTEKLAAIASATVAKPKSGGLDFREVLARQQQQPVEATGNPYDVFFKKKS